MSRDTFTFMSWIRQGLATQIIRREGEAAPGAPAERAAVAVGLTVNETEVTTTLRLFGPEDVRGINTDAIVRHWPARDVFDAEPNFFPLIEFEDADLPWRYTPASPKRREGSTQDLQLTPWLCLVVLSDEEIKARRPSGSSAPLSAIQASVNDLPDLTDAYLWAHVHGKVELSSANDTRVNELLRSTPDAFVSRLLCPRRLKPKTSYTAFLVPTFERGRRAGTGETLDSAIDALRPAWQRGSAGGDAALVWLPTYFEWRFGTGVTGDFEELVRKIEPRPLPPEVGSRSIDARDPGMGVPGATSGEQPDLRVGGALQPLGAISPRWAAIEHVPAFDDVLEDLLEMPAHEIENASSEPPVVVPPLYGQWLAAANELPRTEGWFRELNRNPLLRIAAGLATEVVQKNQTELLTGAWRQFEGMTAINNTMRCAQLARHGGKSIFARHLVTAPNDIFVQLAAPAFGHLVWRTSPTRTLSAVTSGTRIEGVIDPAWRRLTRARGALDRRMGPRRPGLFDRVNGREIRAGGGRPLLVHANTPWTSGARAASTPEERAVIEDGEKKAATTAFGSALLVGLTAFAGDQSATLGRRRAWSRLVDAQKHSTPIGDDLVERVLDEMPGSDAFVPVSLEDLAAGRVPTDADATAAGAAEFRQAVGDFFREVQAQLDVTPSLPAAPTAGEIAGLLSRELDPEETITRAVRFRLRLSPDVEWSPEDLLDPLFVSPSFEQPMWVPLRDLSQDWILPGLEHVPNNSVALLQTNREFVEAYMVGLSHEMGRELLWHEFPTDQRSTYFRQFWNPASFAKIDPPPGWSAADARDLLKDITPIERWEKDSAIGSHSPRGATTAVGDTRLVLLVRGELVRRYPNATIYITRERATREEPHYPLFRGELPPDVVFVGFDITVDTLFSGGWYFVFEEPAIEARFGLDESAVPLRSWSDLSWPAVGVAIGSYFRGSVERDGSRSELALEDRTPPWPPGQATSAAFANITHQKPVRILIPAAQLLAEVRS
jgi:hypothetical protein